MKKLLLTISLLLLCSPSAYSAPTPNSMPSQSPTAQSGSIKFHLVAAVVRNDGIIVSVARTSFDIYPFNLIAVIDEVEKKNNAGPKPTYSDVEAKYSAFCIDSSLGYRKCVSEQVRLAEEEWRDKAWSGLNEAKLKAANGLPSISIQTDLTGQAVVELPPGKYYIWGSYNFGKSEVNWINLPLNVMVGMEKFELSNDNSTSIINKPF